MGRIFGLFLILAAFAVFVSNEFTSSAKGEDKFMMTAAQSDMAEIALGNLAVQRAQSEDVRRFGQMMVDDHTRTSQELTQLAASKNVTLPAEMDNKHRAAVNKLSAMSGDEFDRAFMKQMVKDHQAAVKLFQKQANQRSGDADVTAFASRTLPALQSHLEMARSMNGGLGNANGNSNNSSNMNSNGNRNSNMNMNSNSNMNSNMNMNSNGNMNSNRNTNSNRNMNSNSNMNSNRNSNSNMNSNRNMNSNGNSNRNTNSNSNRNTNSNSNSNSNDNRNFMR